MTLLYNAYHQCGKLLHYYNRKVFWFLCTFLAKQNPSRFKSIVIVKWNRNEIDPSLFKQKLAFTNG